MRVLATVVLMLLVSGCGDRVSGIVNDRFPPISEATQRKAAIDTTAQALGNMANPGLAFGVRLEDLENALKTLELTKQGVTHFKVEGDEQLLTLDIRFDRIFTAQDAGGDANLAEALDSLRPQIEGRLTFKAGFSGALAASTTATPTLEFRILPSLHSLKVTKLKLGQGLDATKAAEVVISVLNRFKDNISGELSRNPVTKVTIPPLNEKPVDIASLLKVKNTSPSVKINVAAIPAEVPFKLGGLAWLIDEDRLVGLVQVASTKVPAEPGATVQPTFEDIRDRIDAHVEDGLNVADADSANWVAVDKALLASTTNSLLAQAGLCVTAQVVGSPETVGTKVKMPTSEALKCGTDKSCKSSRECKFNAQQASFNCRKCLIPSPRLCTRVFGRKQCLGGGGCVTEGDDPFCVANREALQLGYNVQANAEKAACDTGREAEEVACNAAKEVENGLCQVAKATMDTIAATGNFANLETTTRASTPGMQVCLKDFALSPGLDSAQFALDVTGKAQADVEVKFVPLDVVGHLACPKSWKLERKFTATLRESRLGISSKLNLVTDQGTPRLDFEIAPIEVKAKLSPSPTQVLLESVDMRVSCPVLLAGATPLLIALSPFLPELQGNLTHKVPGSSGSVDIDLPKLTVGNTEFSTSLTNTASSLVARATPTAK